MRQAHLEILQIAILNLCSLLTNIVSFSFSLSLIKENGAYYKGHDRPPHSDFRTSRRARRGGDGDG